ncbi:MAG: 2,3-bisphosphoglycerate-independent phosphoglycerate mutase [Gammaproteobacteria bacterium]|nr:2,3-bisphosphoglycerate-independent phosphoglycerate mutase [Gammaproteobacteria bacterium]
MTSSQLSSITPTILIIMDGVGHNPSKLNNAVALASTPNLDRIFSSTPTTVIEASGRAVGLPAGQMGNSEVGHMTLGTGQILRQDLVKISDAIESGEFQQNPALSMALDKCQSGAQLHIVGLVSDGGIHSHIDHLKALLAVCESTQVEPLLHVIADGRDTAPKSVKRFLAQIEAPLAAANGTVASIAGRYYAMDRDNRWERVQAAFEAIACGEGASFNDVYSHIERCYADEISDEFLTPASLDNYTGMNAGDQVVFFNFRNDRPRELSQALLLNDFSVFDRGGFTPIELTTMTNYDPAYPAQVMFNKETVACTLASEIASAGVKQFHTAETEKYPHVTFFFNGGQEVPFDGEDRGLVASPKVATYDLMPEMSARGVCDEALGAIGSGQYGFIVVNFANGDMVGHTGVADAVIKSVEVVDSMVGELWQAATESGWSIILTADHGNADCLVDPVTGEPHTQHTTFPVACAVHHLTPVSLKNGGGLSNIAATVLTLMGLPAPSAMEPSLLL